ncbi:uncharacterized protein LOC130664921 isoform X2 [Microplitis mediator]|uniref:uncharacterized protein LOC130664921 isoform X2 n=1 Tax=Microplitis mediator TaxID=375433 RepID=UPI0025551694|nr:uncharacterized protein LOC130664921 isoform X2 [Microplitis mediator]
MESYISPTTPLKSLKEVVKRLHGNLLADNTSEMFSIQLSTEEEKLLVYNLLILQQEFKKNNILITFHQLDNFNTDTGSKVLRSVPVMDNIFKSKKLFNELKANKNTMIDSSKYHHSIDENIDYYYKNNILKHNRSSNRVFDSMNMYLDAFEIPSSFLWSKNNEHDVKKYTNILFNNLKKYHTSNKLINTLKSKSTSNNSYYHYYGGISIVNNSSGEVDKISTITVLDKVCTDAGSLIHGSDSFLSESPGINTSSFDIGSCGSVTCMHSEVADFPSVAYLVAGAPKIWIIINEDCIGKMKKLFITLNGGTCAAPWEHRNMIFTLDELDAHNIGYKITIQHPGTVVTIREGIFHQIINLGPNIIESCLYAGIRWELLNKHNTVQCMCLDDKNEPLSKNCVLIYNSGLQVKLKQSKKAIHSCKHDSCNYKFTTNADLEAHLRMHHPNKTSTNFACTVCDVCFSTRSNLLRHQRDLHQDKISCPGCKKFFVRISQHLNTSNKCSSLYKCRRGKIIPISGGDMTL